MSIQYISEQREREKSHNSIGLFGVAQEAGDVKMVKWVRVAQDGFDAGP